MSGEEIDGGDYVPETQDPPDIVVLGSSPETVCESSFEEMEQHSEKG